MTRFLVFTVAIAARVFAQGVPAADSVRMTAVTYISGASIYVGAGRIDGVREGMTLDVTRGGIVIATLRAAFLSSRSASCEIVTSTATLIVGDSVRYRPVVDRVVAERSDSGATTRAVARPWRRSVRGYAGVRYVRIDREGTNAPGIGQPSADLHVEATQIGGTPVGFVIDARARRSVGRTAAGPSDEMHVYEGSTSLTHVGSGTRLSVGRQYSPALSAVSLFDGLTLEMNRRRWGAGVFTGLQPDVASMGFSTSIREGGGYLQFHNAPGAGASWSITGGAAESRALGQLNREFAFAQVSIVGSVLSIYGIQELDFNRGWKRDAGEPAISPTSSFGTVQLRLTDWFSVNGGADNRRNVRLYRDFVSPETEFDDAFRQGAWGGVNVSAGRLRASVDTRVSRGGVAGQATYSTATVGIDPATRLGVEARLRSTRFETDRTTGWLHAWSAALSPFGVVRLEVNGGLRTQAVVALTDSTAVQNSLADSRWIGASIDLAVGRSWYLIASGTRDGAGVDAIRQLYGSIVYRF